MKNHFVKKVLSRRNNWVYLNGRSFERHLGLEDAFVYFIWGKSLLIDHMYSRHAEDILKGEQWSTLYIWRKLSRVSDTYTNQLPAFIVMALVVMISAYLCLCFLTAYAGAVLRGGFGDSTPPKFAQAPKKISEVECYLHALFACIEKNKIVQYICAHLSPVDLVSQMCHTRFLVSTSTYVHRCFDCM